MKKSTLLFLCLFASFHLTAQNIVPNPSFEKVNKILNRWISNDMVFEGRMQEWTVPNLGSPDIFFNKVIDKVVPPRKGVDLSPHRARTGEMMVAIKTYGCVTMTQHCKEYIQIQLKTPIEKGEEYFVEFWVHPMVTSIFTNNIGLSFSDVEIQDNSEYGLHYFDPVVIEKSIIKNKPNEWFRIAGKVKSDGNYAYAIIGNFLTDEETEIDKENATIDYAYYFIDDVLIRPLKANSDLNLIAKDLEVGNAITLNNIHFTSGKAILLPSSFKELNNLLDLMNKNPKLKIQINGHTDNEGSEADNLALSKERALAVAKYLSQKGIPKERVSNNGFGEEQPIESNETSEGQKMNRRVEFLVVGK